MLNKDLSLSQSQVLEGCRSPINSGGLPFLTRRSPTPFICSGSHVLDQEGNFLYSSPGCTSLNKPAVIFVFRISGLQREKKKNNLITFLFHRRLSPGTLSVPQHARLIPSDVGKLLSEKVSPNMKALKGSPKREKSSLLPPLKFIRNVLKAIHCCLACCVFRRLRTTPGFLLFLVCMLQN